MKDKSGADLERLLRAAGTAPRSDAEAGMPFGFDTRVVALARTGASRANGSSDLLRSVRRISAGALAILAIASAGAFQQFSSGSDRFADTDETPLSEAYAIADTAIQGELQELSE